MEYVSLKKIHYKQPSIEEEVYQFAHEEVIKEDPRNKLDGEIFRHGSVDIASVTGKTIHRGLYPESSIIDALTQALAILHDENMPLLARVSGFHTGCTLSKVKNQKCLLLQAKPLLKTYKKPHPVDEKLTFMFRSSFIASVFALPKDKLLTFDIMLRRL